MISAAVLCINIWVQKSADYLFYSICPSFQLLQTVCHVKPFRK